MYDAAHHGLCADKHVADEHHINEQAKASTPQQAIKDKKKVANGDLGADAELANQHNLKARAHDR